VLQVLPVLPVFPVFPVLPVPKSQDPRPISKTRDPNGMVKMLPIPSLKKVRITKTKIPTKKSPQDSQSHKKSPHNQDMMLRSKKIMVQFPLLPLLLPLLCYLSREDPKKEIDDPLALY
jgi:hypothetical protein